MVDESASVRSQCLDRRIDDKETILAEVAGLATNGATPKALRSSGNVHYPEGSRKLRKAYPSRNHNLCGPRPVLARSRPIGLKSG